MKTSENGLALLEFREGSRNKAYRDTKGIWTIGVGHTGPEVHQGLVWTDEQIKAALATDVVTAENCINDHVEVPLSQEQFDALVSFVFNVGVTQFVESTLLKKLNVGDYEGAAKQFDRWVIPVEVTGRRMSEKKQFLS